MRDVFIFHGTNGSPEENWFPWLKRELEKLDCRVTVPRFPTPQGQSLESWLAILEEYKPLLNEKIILIGHSLGGLFLLRVLERLPHPVAAAFFVAAPVGVRPILYYEGDEKFSGFSFDWVEIKKKSKRFFVYHSDNDPYVSMANGKELARRLGIKLTFVPKSGHLNAESGLTSFNLLLSDIKGILKTQV